MTKALDGENPVIYGDGAQSRDFVFVQDVVQALLLAAQTPSAFGMIFNVGTGRAISVNELWENVSRLAGTTAAPAYGPPRPGDIRHSVACIDQARNRLSYAPRLSLAEGLATTFAWYRQSRGATG